MCADFPAHVGQTEVLNLLLRLLPGHLQLMCVASQLPCAVSMSFLLAQSSVCEAT